MGSLILRLFGAPEIMALGLPLALPNQKAQALLFYLAVTRRPHTRNHLATLLWSEFPATNARRSLRATLFQLRHALSKQTLSHLLIITGELLHLSPAEITCDVIDFEQGVAGGDAAALTQSISLYRGPFLQGFTLPNAPLFDEWVRQEDEKYSQGYINALYQLADDAAAHEQIDQAIHYLSQLLQADPLAETAHQHLLRLYLKAGAFNQAIRQYHQFAYDLRTRMGLTPTPETRALFHEALHRQQTPLPGKTTAWPGKTTAWPEMKARPQPSIQATTYFEQGEVALISNDYVAASAAAEAGLALCASLSQNPAFSNLAGWGYRLLGHALAMEGSDLPAAERHLRQATATHRQAQNPRDLGAGLFELGNVAAQRGELLPALEFYEEAAQIAAAGQAHYFHALARNNMAYHALLLGWLKVAQRVLAQGRQVAETHELLGALLHLSSTQGEIYLYQAEWLAAQETFQQGLTLAEVMSNPERQAGYRAGLALAARGQQNFDQAVNLLEEALWLISGRGYWHLRLRLLIWLGETLLWVERGAEARPHLELASQTAQAQGRALLHLQAQRLQAMLAATEGDWAAAEVCFSQSLAQATTLDLPLEIARTQSVWGQAWQRWQPHAPQGMALLDQARPVFVAHDAAADLLWLPPLKGRHKASPYH
ncbi:MAG: hypothetical protein KJ063_14005 [Anaerolineae bacterium]|nr:hypothetical protein [Anaerolineae bacterium]